MRQLLLTFTLLLIVMSMPYIGNAQYQTFFGQNEMWHNRIVYYPLDGTPPPPDDSVSVRMSDTVQLGGQTYTKMHCHSRRTNYYRYTFFVREVIPQGQMYIYDTVDNQEYLLVDVSLNLGDTFRTNLPLTEPMYVDSVYYYSGLKHLVLRSKNFDSYAMWADGVGILHANYELDGNWPGLYWIQYLNPLTCVFKDGVKFYRDYYVDTNYDCYRMVTIDDILVHHEDVQVYPNPATKDIHFKGLAKEDIFTFFIIDVMGRIVVSQSGQPNPLSISGLEDGHYVLIVKDKEGAMVLRQRIAVQH
jgi:hypothetical protein